MKTCYLSAAMLALCAAGAYGQGKDPLTGLPVIPAAETIFQGKSLGFKPSELPASAVCKGKMKGEFYALSHMNVKDNNEKVSTAVAWYAAHLSGFNKIQGYGYGKSQTAFYNPGGTMVVLITGNPGKTGEDTGVYGIAYQRYDPGLSEKTTASLTHSKIVCQ